MKSIARFAIAAALVAFIVWWLFPSEPCLKLLNQESNLGIRFDMQFRGVFDLGAAQKSTAATPEQMRAFTDCMRLNHPGVELKGVIFNRQPIGQLAAGWNDEPGMQVTLVPEKDRERRIKLNNLAIGPDAGSKQTVLSRWCRANASCVACEPEITDSSSQIFVHLQQEAPTKKVIMGTFAPPRAGDPDYQLKDADGTRYYFMCESMSNPSVLK